MKKTIAVLFVLACFVSIVFFQMFTHGKDSIILGSDVVRYLGSRYLLLSNTIGEGQLPVWHPYSQSGTNIYGDTMMMVFYPPILLMYLADNLHYLGFIIFFHMIFAGFFAFFLGRSLKLSNTGSMMAALIYAFSGQVMANARAGQMQHLISFTFYPLVMLLFISLLLKKNKLLYSIMLAFTLFFAFLGAHIQYFFYIGVSFLVLSIYYFFVNRHDMRNILKTTCYIGIAVIFFLAFSLFQLYPYAEFAKFQGSGVRGTYAFATEGSFHPTLFVRFLFPNAYGFNESSYFFFTYYGENPYVSIFALVSVILIAWLFLTGKKLDFFEKFFLLLFFIGIFFMLGRFNPLYSIFYRYLSADGLFRLPARWMIISLLSASLLSGFCLDRLFKIKDKSSWQKTTKIYKLLAILCGIALASVSVMYLFSNSLAKLLFNIYQRMSSTNLLTTIDFGFIVERVNLLLKSNVLFIALSLTIVLCSLWLLKKNLKYTKFALILITFLDLALMLPWPQFGPAAVAFKPNPIEEYLISHAPVNHDWRVLEVQDWGKDEVLQEYTMVRYKIDSASWTGQTETLANYYNYIKSLYYEDIESKANLEKMKTFGVKYLITDKKLSDPTFKLVMQNQGAFLYELSAYGPRITLLKQGDAQIIRYEQNMIISSVNTSTKNTLFLSEVYTPFWQASVNGKPATLYECKETFRCVDVDKGQSAVVVRYVPKYLSVTLLVFAIAVIVSIILIIFISGRQRKIQTKSRFSKSTSR